MAKLVSATYGEALFELAKEENKVLALLEEVTALRTILTENTEFGILLANPKVSKEECIAIVRNVFEGKISKELMGFLELLLQKGRYNELMPILDYFIDRVKEAEKIGTAYVTTAVALDEKQKGAIEAKLLETTSYRKIEVEYTVDESLIGGMVIRIRDRVVDSSVRTKLEKMQRMLSEVQLV